MAAIQDGISSPDVKKIQQQINGYYQASVVPESGEFDSTTTDGVMRFQKDVHVRATWIVDDATMKLLIRPPKISGHLVKFKGDELWLTDEQYKDAVRAVAKAAAPVVDGYRRKADEVRNIWDPHSEVRKITFFLIPILVDVWAGVSLPNESIIKAAESAVAKMDKAVKGSDVDAINDALRDGPPPVEAATKAMKQYRNQFYDGGEDLIKSLETLKDGCVDVLEVSAAIATGGSSMAVTAGLMASVGAYKSMLGEIDKASTTPKFSLTDAFGDVLVDGAVAGTVGALLHDDGVVGGVTGEVSKKFGGTVLKKFGSDVAAKVAAKVVEKAFKGGADKAAQKIVEDLVESFKPGSKMTLDKAVKDISEDFLKGAVYGSACVAMSEDLEDFTNKSLKYCKAGVFKGLGKVDMKKAWDKGGEQIVEAAMKRIGNKLIVEAADDPRKMKDVTDTRADEIANDPKLNAEMTALVKKYKLQ
jgi:peptidoglycan hydrolase-like protein with peptidoglycan-binding domain